MKIIHFRYKHKAFTLLESLISLSITSFAIVLLQLYLSVCLSSLHISPIQQYQIATLQLRLLLAPLSNYEIHQNRLFVSLMGEEIWIELNENRLVQTPGFIIYADNIDDLNFHEKNACLYMTFISDKLKEEVILYCE